MRPTIAIAALAWVCPLVAFAQTTICVDPGHGGADPGAVGCGFEEEDIVIDTSLRLRDLLTAAGFRVVMTRSTDRAVSLAGRSSLANSEGAARFMSIHANSAASVATGIETFCSNNASANSIDLRDQIQSEMIATWPLRNRGGKTANFSVLVNTNMPATLTELGFVNNCSVDVRYLTDPNERQRAAQAHVDALVRHLGGSPQPTTGTLTGVVYEDQGSGIADTSVRLEGATLTIIENSATQMSAPTTGSWRFELEPGTYTVRAERTGHAPTARTCQVNVGDVTWCSIGLFPEGATMDAGTMDAGEFDAGMVVDSGVLDSGVTDGGSIATDAGATTIPPPHDAGEPPLIKAMDADDGCGCTGTERGASAAWALLLLVPLLRRRWWLVLLLIPQPAGAAEPMTFQGAREIAVGHTPRVAPDGTHVLFTNRTRDRVFVLSLEDGSSRLVVKRSGAGYRPEWSADSRSFGVRSQRRPFTAEPLMQFDLLGSYRGPQPRRAPVEQTDAISLGNEPITKPGVRAFAPMVDPNGAWLAYETLAEGLYLVRIADRRTLALGRGSAPSFSGDGQRLVFERTRDDGHRIVGSSLFIVDLSAERPKPIALPDGPGAERFPTLSGQVAESRVLVYEIDGHIFATKLVGRR